MPNSKTSNNLTLISDCARLDTPQTYMTLLQDTRYRIIHHTLQTGQTLATQAHFHSNKMLIAVAGSGSIDLNGTIIHLFEGQVTHIPFGTPHNVINTGKILMKILEVRLGSYLEDDDQIAS